MLVPTQAQSSNGGGGGGEVPFTIGSQKYREIPFFSASQLIDGSQHTITPTPAITPGNFLDGIVLQITSTGGTLGTTAVVATNPAAALSVLNSVNLTDTGGGDILYPMGLYQYYLCQKWFTPWLGDPIKRSDYSNTINPAVTIRLRAGVRDTLAILANTDARAQYRLNLTFAPNTAFTNVTTGVTYPTVTVKGYIDAWAQPDAVDLAGRPIAQLPPGLGVSRFIMHETESIVSAGTSLIRFNLTGNEIRAIILLFKNSSGVPTDLTDANAGPLRFRLDNRVIWTMNPTQIVEEMAAFYKAYYGADYVRDTGVYVIPRFRSPGDLTGEFWLPTVEQTFMQIEFGAADVASGTVEVIYDQLAVAGALPAELEGV